MVKARQQQLPDGSHSLILQLAGTVKGENIKEICEGILVKPEYQNIREVILNFHDVDRMNSSGIGELIRLVDKFEEKKGEILFSNIPLRVLTVLQIMNLDSVLKMYDTEEQALNYIMVEKNRGVLPAIDETTMGEELVRDIKGNFLSRSQVLEILNIDDDSLESLIEEGKITISCSGGKTRFLKSEIEGLKAEDVSSQTIVDGNTSNILESKTLQWSIPKGRELTPLSTPPSQLDIPISDSKIATNRDAIPNPKSATAQDIKSEKKARLPIIESPSSVADTRAPSSMADTKLANKSPQDMVQLAYKTGILESKIEQLEKEKKVLELILKQKDEKLRNIIKNNAKTVGDLKRILEWQKRDIEEYQKKPWLVRLFRRLI